MGLIDFLDFIFGYNEEDHKTEYSNINVDEVWYLVYECDRKGEYSRAIYEASKLVGNSNLTYDQRKEIAELIREDSNYLVNQCCNIKNYSDAIETIASALSERWPDSYLERETAGNLIRAYEKIADELYDKAEFYVNSNYFSDYINEADKVVKEMFHYVNRYGSRYCSCSEYTYRQISDSLREKWRSNGRDDDDRSY